MQCPASQGIDVLAIMLLYYTLAFAVSNNTTVPLVWTHQVNQIGSVTESIEAVRMSKHAGWGVMTSHRRYDASQIFYIVYLILYTSL